MSEAKSPLAVFGNPHYQRHNARRLEHLASMRLPLAGTSVLELGAGVGDHTGFFLDRGCRVTAVEARQENIEVFEARKAAMAAEQRSRLVILQGDLDTPQTVEAEDHDVVYSYGLLYHLENPEAALEWKCRKARRLLLLETCVSFGGNEQVRSLTEDRRQPSQSFRGGGSRPTRAWIFARLKREFPHVYLPRTQPAHEEFPTDWRTTDGWASHARAIFVASREPIEDPLFASALPAVQVRR